LFDTDRPRVNLFVKKISNRRYSMNFAGDVDSTECSTNYTV